MQKTEKKLSNTSVFLIFCTLLVIVLFYLTDNYFRTKDNSEESVVNVKSEVQVNTERKTTKEINSKIFVDERFKEMKGYDQYTYDPDKIKVGNDHPFGE